MWQRFTERARKVVFYAQEEAQKFGEGYVSTEHLLLGLIREADSVGCRVLELMGKSLARIREEVEKQLPRSERRQTNDMTLTPRAKRIIDLAYDEARNLNNNYIGTEHILLGLIREGDGLAGRVLEKVGVGIEAARAVVIQLQDQEGDTERSPKGTKKQRSKARKEPATGLDTPEQHRVRMSDERIEAEQRALRRERMTIEALLALLALDEGSMASRILSRIGHGPRAFGVIMHSLILQAARESVSENAPTVDQIIVVAYDEARGISGVEGVPVIDSGDLLLAALRLSDEWNLTFMSGIGISLDKARQALKEIREGAEPTNRDD